MAAARGLDRSRPASARARSAIAKRLGSQTSAMTTATIAEMAARHDWFRELDAEHRSWITLVAGAGIDGFVTWFADTDLDGPPISDVFGLAPRELARRITLHQTVELVRTTIDVVETQIDEVMPRADRPVLHTAIVAYSREVAFAAAEVYARAAELRGTWDARLEASVVDAVVRGEADDSVLSRASTLGWASTQGVVVVVGGAPAAETPSGDAAAELEAVRHLAAVSGLDMLGAVQGDRMIVVLGGPPLADPAWTNAVVSRFVSSFAAGPVVIGPPVEHLMDTAASAREALSGYRAVIGWPAAPRPVSTHDLLPERALNGDGHARRALARELHDPLRDAGGGLLETLTVFLDQGLSVEATARALFVHANTVRYRLRRIHEVSGYSPTNPRDAYALRLALTLGRLLGRPTRTGEATGE